MNWRKLPVQLIQARPISTIQAALVPVSDRARQANLGTNDTG